MSGKLEVIVSVGGVVGHKVTTGPVATVVLFRVISSTANLPANDQSVMHIYVGPE